MVPDSILLCRNRINTHSGHPKGRPERARRWSDSLNRARHMAELGTASKLRGSRAAAERLPSTRQARSRPNNSTDRGAISAVLGDAFAPVRAVSMFVAGGEARSRDTTQACRRVCPSQRRRRVVRGCVRALIVEPFRDPDGMPSAVNHSIDEGFVLVNGSSNILDTVVRARVPAAWIGMRDARRSCPDHDRHERSARPVAGRR